MVIYEKDTSIVWVACVENYLSLSSISGIRWREKKKIQRKEKERENEKEEFSKEDVEERRMVAEISESRRRQQLAFEILGGSY